MDTVKVVILGIVQGVTEFLPVSSSGHLVVMGQFMNTEGDSLLLNVCLHFGTLVSIIVVYWHEIWRILRDDRKVIVYLVAATVPVAVLGVCFGDWFEKQFENMNFVGYFFILTGLVLIAGRYADKRIAAKKPLDWGRCAAVGLAQAVALLPGVSRSGSTISTGLIFRMDRNKAATFAFLMAIPAISGALGVKLLKLATSDAASDFNVGTLLAGMAAAAIVGYFALKLLLKIVHRGNFSWFSIYCFSLGVCVIVYSWLKR